MLFLPSLSALLIGLSSWLGSGEAVDQEPDLAVQRMVVRDEIILHIPIVPPRSPRFTWEEHRGPKCLPAAMIAGAAMVTPATIDFVMRDRRRFRARFDSDCAGLDFYGGFYLEPQDGAVCARREEIRSRAGTSCRIERFRSLQPKYKR